MNYQVDASIAPVRDVAKVFLAGAVK